MDFIWNIFAVIGILCIVCSGLLFAIACLTIRDDPMGLREIEKRQRFANWKE